MLTKVESGFWLLKWYHQGILEEIDYYSKLLDYSENLLKNMIWI